MTVLAATCLTESLDCPRTNARWTGVGDPLTTRKPFIFSQTGDQIKQTKHELIWPKLKQCSDFSTQFRLPPRSKRKHVLHEKIALADLLFSFSRLRCQKSRRRRPLLFFTSLDHERTGDLRLGAPRFVSCERAVHLHSLSGLRIWYRKGGQASFAKNGKEMHRVLSRSPSRDEDAILRELAFLCSTHNGTPLKGKSLQVLSRLSYITTLTHILREY